MDGILDAIRETAGLQNKVHLPLAYREAATLLHRPHARPVEQAHSGEVHHTSMVEKQHQSSVTRIVFETLSARELEVLRLIAAGLSNRDIAQELFITLNTTKDHTKSIYGKLGVSSRTQAVARARELGILPP